MAGKHLDPPASHSFQKLLSGTLLCTLNNLRIASPSRVLSVLVFTAQFSKFRNVVEDVQK
jgi:predicted solute-binding protein